MASFTEHLTPRISSNMIGEYIMANEGRRQKILIDQKSPSYPVAYYTSAESGIRRYFLSPNKDENLISNKIQQLSTIEIQSKNKAVKIGYNIEALEDFLQLPGRANFDLLTMRPGPRKAYLNIDGVDVSIRPELIVFDAKTKSFGLIKLRFSKSDRSLDISEFVATVLVAYAQSCALQQGQTANLDLTYVIDVFGRSVCKGNSIMSNRWAEVQNACAEIATRWPLIKPRNTRGQILSKTKIA